MGSTVQSSPDRRTIGQRRRATTQDVLVYEAIVGQWGKGASAGLRVADESVEPVQAAARRAWPADVAQVSERVRQIFEMGIANGVKKPEMAQWLRHMSGEAFRRLEEAQARLSTARRSINARRVEARVIRPAVLRPHEYQHATPAETIAV